MSNVFFNLPVGSDCSYKCNELVAKTVVKAIRAKAVEDGIALPQNISTGGHLGHHIRISYRSNVVRDLFVSVLTELGYEPYVIV